MKILISIIASLGLILTVGTAAAEPTNPIVIIKTSVGNIKVELDNSLATVTQKNFLHYVQEGSYNGTIFHRVIKGFMIQGGGFSPDMIQIAPDAAPIINEGKLCGMNTRGTIAMARTSDPHSATSQFFINTADNPFLDFTAETNRGWGYCSFGHVIEGMDAVYKIEAMPTTSVGSYQDVPVNSVIIRSVELVGA